MKQKYVIGIDVSKSKLDCTVMDSDFNIHSERAIVNDEKHLNCYLREIVKTLEISYQEILVCCENTGIYNRPLEKSCMKLNISLWVEHALRIKRASTDLRGKSDRKDAIRIAEYAIRYNDKMIPYTESSERIREINILIRSRETLLSQRVSIENQLREAKSHDDFEYQILMISYKKVLKTLETSIKETEKKIEHLTIEDQEIRNNKELLMSIPGIGNVCAVNLIVITRNFQLFKDAKHLACYAGVVPFKNESGTIIKKEKVSKMANGKIKKLLHMAAMACIRADQELKDYFLRKVEQGKNKMSVLNAVKNKLIHRIIAVINRGRPFVSKEDFLNNRDKITCI